MIITHQLFSRHVVIATVIFLTLSSIIAFIVNSRYEDERARRDHKLQVQKLLNKDVESCRSLLSSVPPPKPPCNPFLLPGYIDPKTDSWTPIYSSTCTPILKKQTNGFIPQYLRDKRYYFYGDTTSRYIMSDFCRQFGAEMQVLPNPAGYQATNEQPAIDYCSLDSINFKAVSIYTFGLKEYDKKDRPFLKAHAHHNINNEKNIDPMTWRFEDRMITPNKTLGEMLGVANIVFLSSGLWDLYHLQRLMTSPKAVQTLEPPIPFLQRYASRWRKYINTARSLHPNSMIYVLNLQDPTKFDVAKNFGLEGYEPDNVEFSCLAEARVRAIRDTSIAVALDEKQEGRNDVQIVPYDVIVRAAPQEKRMRDMIHPSQFVNEVLGTALVWFGKLLDEK